jgi:hypothetical protein
MKRYFFLIFLGLFLSTKIGCRTPSDLPSLAEFQITVTKGGIPAEGVVVTVHSDTLLNKYSCYGVVDSNGFLSLTTHSLTDKRKFTGAPVGHVKIGIRRLSNFGLEDPRIATKGMSREESYAYSAERAKRVIENEKYVPLSLADPLISPIEFTISQENINKLTIELDDSRWNIKIDPRRLKKH